MNMFEITFYIIVPILGLMWYYEKKRFDTEGINWHPFSDSSFPNPTRRLKGNFWWDNSHLKRIFKKSAKNDLKLDNFVFAESFKRHISPFKFPFFKPAEVHIPSNALVESLLLLAPVKGGKTTTLNNWVAGDFYDRMIINERKSGDFTSKFYNKRKDIILNPYDERSHIWDILSEPIPIIEFYIINALNQATKNESFFTSDAKERYKKIAKLTLDIKDPKEKWKVFIDELEYMFKEVEAGNQKSAKDVISTMTQILEPLQLSSFLIEQGKKTFTISEFFQKKNQTKLFMVMIDTYVVNLSPLFTAFTACVAMHQASLPEYAITKSLTVYLLDEYLELDLSMEGRKILHLKIRSKGGVVISACQSLPNDKEQSKLLTTSTYGYMIFSLKDDETIDFVSKKVGKWKYGIYKTLNGQQQEHTEESNILDWSEMDKLSASFHHVTYLPESGALYVGKSDYVDYPVKCDGFIYDNKIEDFYRWQNEEYKKSQTKKTNGASATMQGAKSA